jgi:hypothetical protein
MALTRNNWKCRKCGKQDDSVHFNVPFGMICDACLEEMNRLLSED